jgi:hypothetical protein
MNLQEAKSFKNKKVLYRCKEAKLLDCKMLTDIYGIAKIEVDKNIFNVPLSQIKTIEFTDEELFNSMIKNDIY